MIFEKVISDSLIGLIGSSIFRYFTSEEILDHSETSRMN